jgi:hypothetical protein
VATAQQAVKLGDTPETRDTLAAAYAEAGMFDQAVAEQTRAIEMARAKGRGVVQPFEERLSLYQHHLAYHETRR